MTEEANMDNIWTRALEDWRAKVGALNEISRRCKEKHLATARQLCQEAGLDPHLLGIHPHNAMVAMKQGRPWKGVDYSKVRQCMFVMKHMYMARDVVNAWDRRNWPNMTVGGDRVA